MSQVTDFIGDFEKMIKDKSLLEARLVNLRGQIDEASKNLDGLLIKHQALLKEIEDAKKKAFDEIDKAKADMQLVLDKEDRRITSRNQELDKKIKVQKDNDDRQSQKQGELNEFEEKLNGIKKQQDHTQVELDSGLEFVRSEKEKNELAAMKNSERSSALDKQAIDNQNTADDINLARVFLKADQEKLAEGQKNLEIDNEALKSSQEILDAFAVELGNRKAELDKREADVKVSEKKSAEKKKDQDDREASLNAMKTDLDFREAKIRTKEKNANT